MAKKLSQAELRRIASDFDPPTDPTPKAHRTTPLTNGKRVRVTASLTQEQYEKLKKLAKRHGLPMSKTLGVAVEALYKH